MDFSLTTLYVLPSGNLAPDNFKRENLHPTQFGIFNSRYKAVTNATDAAKSPYIQFGQGRIENVPGLTGKYSDKVSQRSLIEWYKVSGSKEVKNQITYVGFDGINDCKTLDAECDQQYSITIRAFSQYINTAFSGNGLNRTVTVTTPCCDKCGDDCTTVDCKWVASEFARKINEEPFLSKYVVATPIYKCDPALTEVRINTVDYCVTICDEGLAGDLATVQAQYPNVDISVKSRSGSLTTYTFSQLASDSVPAALQLTSPVALAVCGTCPPTYTLVAESRCFIIERPINGAAPVLVTDTNKQAYATTIATAYGGTGVFLINEGGSVKVKVCIPTATVPVTGLVALLQDIVVEVDNQEALCTPPVGATVAWVACGVGYKVQRTLCLTITNDCAGDLALVQAHYPNDIVTLAETENCNSVYNIVQTSDTIQEDCGFGVVPQFRDVQPYKGIEWVICPCPTAPVTPSTCICGVKIEGKPLDVYGNPCDPVAFPFEYDKLRFDVFAYKAPATSQDFNTFDRCENWDITTTQRSTYVSGSGLEIKALEIRYHSYQTTHKHIYHTPAYNGGFIQYSDESKFYDTYYIKFASPDLNIWDNVSRQDEMVIIAVPEGQSAQLESFLLGYFGPEKFTAGVLVGE